MHAQTTFATITGTVTDGSGAIVPNAKISAANIETGVVISGASNDAGAYTLPQLKEGTYTVTATAAGFNQFNATGIVLAARDIRRIDMVLQVGTTSTSIEVTAGASVIETETARITAVQDAKQFKTLPLNARWLTAYLQLIPNYNAAGSERRFGGSLGNQVGWNMDGTSIHDGVSDFIGSQQNYIESFEQVKVDVGTTSAAYNGIGQLTVISKSGTNALHAAVFDYYATPWFRARNPFTTARQPGVSHLYGASIGGPVYIPKLYHGKNRTFFFFSREGSVGGDTVDILNPTVPLAAWRAGNFSSLTATIYDPASGTPFPNNTIPGSRISPFAQKYQDKFYPLPNYGNPDVFAANNYRELKTKAWARPVYHAVRIDHHLSENDILWGRFTFTQSPGTKWESNLPTVGLREALRPTRSATISYLHTFSPTLMNEVRFGLLYNNGPYHGAQSGDRFISEFGIKGLAPDVPTAYGITNVSFTGGLVQSVSASTWGDPSYKLNNQQYQDQLSWFHGRHSIMIGADIMRVMYDDYVVNPNTLGSLNFSSRFTGAGRNNQGSPYADFLLGLPSTLNRDPAPLHMLRRRLQTDFFVQDDFKVNGKLTLNLGVRYELHLPWTEENGLMSAFDIATGSIIVPDSAVGKVSPLFPSRYVPVIAASKAGYNARSLLNADKNNFAPRIGFAWRPLGPRTSIRGGFSVGYEMVPFLPSTGGSPFVLNEVAYTNPATNPTVLPNIFPASGNSGPGTVQLPAGGNPNLRMPVILQYSLTIEHQLAENWGSRLSYMNTSERQGVFGYDYNQPVADTRPYASKPRPFPQYSGISYYTNGQGHSYNALTAELTRRMSKGMFFQTGFTWARDIGDMIATENAYDRHRDVGVIGNIPTFRLVSSAIYELPFGKGKKWASNVSRLTNLMVSGWTLTALFTAQTGSFLTPWWTGSDPTGTAYSASNTAAQVTRRPDAYSDPNTGARTVTSWFNTAAFGPPLAGQFGSAAPGLIKGPGVNIWNLSFNKDFFFGERAPHLRWEMSAINAFNHPNYANPATNISNTTSLGVISGVGGVTQDTLGPRALRMGLRLEF